MAKKKVDQMSEAYFAKLVLEIRDLRERCAKALLAIDNQHPGFVRRNGKLVETARAKKFGKLAAQLKAKCELMWKEALV